MYMKTLLGLIYVLLILNNVDSLPVNGQASYAGLSPDNIDQSMKEAVQTLLAGLIIKGNDLRAELQEEARALLEDPYPFDDDYLSENAKYIVAPKAVEATEQIPTNPEDDDDDDEEEEGEEDDLDHVPGGTYSAPETRGGHSQKAAKSRRSLADDTLNQLRNFYIRSEIEPHHRFSDLFHLSSIANFLAPTDLSPTYPMTPLLAQPMPTVSMPPVDPVPDVAPPVLPDPAVPAVDAPIPDVVTPPVEAPLPEVPDPVARSVVDDEQNSQYDDEKSL